ncbi:MAG TPA: hypothetical protein VFV53_08245 [Candidatus Limnocylindrales bacterium]|nr:hypothetical protein [Candidatus Limnocylindrales bacterium]
MTERRPAMSVPAHLGVILGLSTGAYALTLAAVTGLQSSAEAATRMERAPTITAIDTMAADHDRLTARLDAARAAYEAAAGVYGDAGLQVADLGARLDALVAAVGEVSGTASSLPSSVQLPPIARSVAKVAAPATQATTGASGG